MAAAVPLTLRAWLPLRVTSREVFDAVFVIPRGDASAGIYALLLPAFAVIALYRLRPFIIPLDGACQISPMPRCVEKDGLLPHTVSPSDAASISRRLREQGGRRHSFWPHELLSPLPGHTAGRLEDL